MCLTTEAAARSFGPRPFTVPLRLPSIPIGMAWHPRNDADPAHRWLRSRIRSTFRS